MERLGENAGVLFHVLEGDEAALQVLWLAEEAVQISAIEGELLYRNAVQASLLRRRIEKAGHAQCPDMGGDRRCRASAR